MTDSIKVTVPKPEGYPVLVLVAGTSQGGWQMSVVSSDHFDASGLDWRARAMLRAYCVRTLERLTEADYPIRAVSTAEPMPTGDEFIARYSGLDLMSPG